MKIKFAIAGIVIFSVILSGKNLLSSPPPHPCDFKAVMIDVPLQLQEAVTMDGGQNPLLTRFFHNKLLFYTTNLTQCYLKYFQPAFLVSLIGFFGFFLLVFWVYLIFVKKRKFMSNYVILIPLIIPLLYLLGFIHSWFLFLLLFSLNLWLIILLGSFSLLEQPLPDSNR